MMDLPGYKIVKVLGTGERVARGPAGQRLRRLVFGITVRSRNLAASLGMVIKSFAGGELRWFTSMLYACRNDSISRVVDECKRRGGNAIICLRFDSGDMGGFAQTAAYGTAVVVVKVDDEVQAPSQLLP